MDGTAWTVIGTGITILIAIGAAFRNLRSEMRLFREHVDRRIDAQGERITTQGDQLRERIDAQGEQLRERIDAQGEQLRGTDRSTRKAISCANGSMRKAISCANGSTRRGKKRANRLASCANGWQGWKACSKASARR